MKKLISAVLSLLLLASAAVSLSVGAGAEGVLTLNARSNYCPDILGMESSVGDSVTVRFVCPDYLDAVRVEWGLNYSEELLRLTGISTFDGGAISIDTAGDEEYGVTASLVCPDSPCSVKAGDTFAEFVFTVLGEGVASVELTIEDLVDKVGEETQTLFRNGEDVREDDDDTIDDEPIDVLVDPFSDVPEDAYYLAAVNWAVATNIAKGTGGGKFSPEVGCTRAQVVTLLWRAAGSPDPIDDDNSFSDVKKNDYFYDAVLWAVQEGITKGVSADRFSPDSTCTRGQIVTFLYRSNGSPSPVGGSNPFSDVKDDDYFFNAVLWAVGQGITKGTSATAFSPDATCTRAQIVTFLFRDRA